MPWGATGVLPRIGTSCCAANGMTTMASAAAERKQKNPFIPRLPGNEFDDTGLCIVFESKASE